MEFALAREIDAAEVDFTHRTDGVKFISVCAPVVS